MILSWDKPEKVMSTAEWQRISADGAPPGVYTPNMSAINMAKWKAKYVGGENPRVEIRKTVIGPSRSVPYRDWLTNSYAQVLIIVDATSVRMSANGTAHFENSEFDQLAQAVDEARVVVLHRKKEGES